MKITKDEARILEMVLADGKYTLIEELDPEIKRKVFDKLANLETKLDDFSLDGRRHGRKSHNSFTDCLKRYANVK